MSKNEEELRGLIVELQILERTSEALQARIGLVNASVNELRMASETLEGLKREKEGSTILLPIGGGSYLKARVEDLQTLIVGIGADVATEKTTDAAQADLATNILELEKARNALQQQLEQTLSRLDAVRRQVQEMTQQAPEGKT